MIFKRHHLSGVCAAGLLSLCCVPVHADDISLENGGKLSGKVSAITVDGHVQLTTPLSAKPLDLRADHIGRIAFTNDRKPTDEHDSLIVLTNGDQFPCDLQSIDDQNVQVTTAFAGPLTIPRKVMRTLQLGVRPRKTIYEGPGNTEGWEIKSGWRYVDQAFTAESQGVLSRRFDLTENHSIAFDLGWGSVPNLQIGFDDDSLEPNAKADRYVLSINGGGLDLKREQEQGNRRFLPMANIPRDFMGQPDQTVAVELKIDRKLGRVSLFLDGRFEGRWADPTGHAPPGKGVFFRAIVAGQDNLRVDAIRIAEWDSSSDRHRSEERGDSSKDSIILRDGDRGMGDILAYRSTSSTEGTLVYKMPHRAEPLETPSSEISTLFFAEKPSPPAKNPLTLVLQGRGLLGLTRLSFDQTGFQVNHPLLGDLHIAQDSINRVIRRQETNREEDANETEQEDDSDQ